MTIPKGVNVVMLEMYGTNTEDMYHFSYVGVTPGKTYNLEGIEQEFNEGEGWLYATYNASTYRDWFFLETGYLDTLIRNNNLRLVISWSPTINEKSPHYTDY